MRPTMLGHPCVGDWMTAQDWLQTYRFWNGTLQSGQRELVLECLQHHDAIATGRTSNRCD